MDATEEHYARLLGLESPWKVARVKLSVNKMRVDIFVEYGELTGTCPECGATCRVYDRSPGKDKGVNKVKGSVKGSVL